MKTILDQSELAYNEKNRETEMHNDKTQKQNLMMKLDKKNSCVRDERTIAEMLSKTYRSDILETAIN